MIHPDAAQRLLGFKRLALLCGACREIGTEVITLCTGTRDPDNMWRRHPDNDSAEAWQDLVATMSRALSIADEEEVTLAVEPEVSNVIDSAVKARRLIEEMARHD
jgi:sugar phosphate isomerase/epimerase